MQIDDANYSLLSKSSGELEIISSNLSILPDVVANSLNHHLLNYVARSNCGPLNSPEAIEGYPLADQFIITGQNDVDLIYPYPVA